MRRNEMKEKIQRIANFGTTVGMKQEGIEPENGRRIG